MFKNNSCWPKCCTKIKDIPKYKNRQNTTTDNTLQLHHCAYLRPYATVNKYVLRRDLNQRMLEQILYKMANCSKAVGQPLKRHGHLSISGVSLEQSIEDYCLIVVPWKHYSKTGDRRYMTEPVHANLCIQTAMI